MRRYTLPLLLVAFALAAAACGEESEAGAGGGGGSDQLSIESPSEGAEVSVPFTLQFSSSEELGPTDTGAFHIHVFYDGNEAEYEVVESDTFEVGNLSAGEHTITASLRNADHSAAGAEDEISVTVSGGGGGGDGGDGGGGGGYGDGGGGGY
jgi:hypothetical protein